MSESEFQPAGKPELPEALSELPDASVMSGTDGVNQLRAELEAALAKATELQDAYLRAKAEADNTRRRSQDEVAKAHKYGIEKFAESLVPVMDSLHAALATQNATPETMKEGMEMTLRQLVAAFEKGGVVELNPVGEKFDPRKHQAIASVPAEAEPNTVVAVMQRGYLIADRILRPALVTVAAGH
jgi:molecular chaperone GrpE